MDKSIKLGIWLIVLLLGINTALSTATFFKESEETVTIDDGTPIKVNVSEFTANQDLYPEADSGFLPIFPLSFTTDSGEPNWYFPVDVTNRVSVDVANRVSIEGFVFVDGGYLEADITNWP